MSRSSKVIDLRKGPSRNQAPLFSVRSWREPESPKRRTPLRIRRLKMRAMACIALCIVLAGVVWGMSWLSHLSQFSINSVSVAGAREIPQPLIQNYVESMLQDGSYALFSRSNMFLYPRSGIEKAVENFFPRIKSAQISRESLLANSITVLVEERTPFAAWCLSAQTSDAAGRCYVMDDGGFVFAERFGTENTLATHYIFRGGLSAADSASSTDSISSSQTNPIGRRFAPAHLPGILVLLTLLGQAGFNPEGGSIDANQDFLVPFAEGFMLKVSFGQDANTLTKNLQLVLSSEPLKGKEHLIEYIDLRFDNRVYYKLKGEVETPADASVLGNLPS